MKKYFLLSIFSSLLLLSACNGEDAKLDNVSPIYQQYEVLVQKDQIAAFANFRAYGPTGQRVRLNNGASITVNNQKMIYTDSKSDTDPQYNYSTFLSPAAKAAVFKFVRGNGMTYTSTANIDTGSMLKLPEDISTIILGKEYDCEIGFEDSSFLITLLPNGEEEISKGYKATFTPATEGITKFSFNDIPAGSYYLVADKKMVYPVTPGSANAGGTLTVIYRQIIKTTVKSAE